MDTSFRQDENSFAKVIQVASQPVHCVENNGVTFAHVFDELLELRAVHVLARSPVDKPLVESYPFKLAQFPLIENTHAQVADHLIGPALPFCRVWFLRLRHLV